MATYELNNHGVFSEHDAKSGTVLERIRKAYAKLFVTSEERRAYNETLSELQSMSDRDLNDIGITRGDIYRIAREAAEMKRVKV
ncbi:MAG: DUF1127 domain-containing protein [Hyphomicrobiales bacterium]|nr:DUF1127 domain-containing protein [Hyphomicrobiales bacterium]